MQIEEVLTELNLTPREARVYTALLEMGEGTPITLSRKTGLKRTTIYLDLESLRQKQLAGLMPKGKKSVYIAEPASRLLQRIQQQERAVREILPQLHALENKSGTKPTIRYYTNLKDIERVWVEETYHAEENLYLSNYIDTLKLFPNLDEEYERQIKRGVIKVARELHPATREHIAHALEYQSKIRKIRIIPPHLKFDVDLSIWNDSIALYSDEHRHMLVITDKGITNSFRAMFAMAWMVSKDPKEVKEQNQKVPKSR